MHVLPLHDDKHVTLHDQSHHKTLSVIPQLDGLESDTITDDDESFDNQSVYSPSLHSSFSSPTTTFSCSTPTPQDEESWFSQHEISHYKYKEELFIPVHIGHRPTKPPPSTDRLPRANITIKRDNKFIKALSLPTFSVYNMRSIWSKLSSLSEDMTERETDFSILSEVWERRENLKHKNKIEEVFEMKNMSYFSTPRPGNKRGGGTAITAKGDRFKVTKLNINIPKPLEVVWCLLQPKTLLGGGVSKIILCSFYSPPNSRKKSALIDHLAITVNSLKIIHPKASFIIAGDKNDLNEVEICSICPSFRQIVQKPTRKKKTLTVVITDLHTLYQEPLIIPPVPVDCGEAGVPSDHQGVLALPVNSVAPPKSSKKTLIIRPIKDSSLRSFGEKIVLEDWIFLDPDSTPTSLVGSFQKFCSLLIEEPFPLKTVNVSSHDLPY